MNNKSLLFLSVFVIVVFIFLLITFIMSSFGSSSKTTTIIPTITLSPNGNSLPDQKPSTQEQKQGSQDSLVGQLVDKLPYVGKNFSLYYDFHDFQFTLYLNPNNKLAGNQEFDQFLKNNGIGDRSWIENAGLFTTYLKPTPTPAP